FVALLRTFDDARDPARIHPLHSGDHAERLHALRTYRLEECLYPHYSWVVPLYEPDTRWDRLLAPLRAVEAMMLHQGEVEGRDATRGQDFIGRVRKLGDEAGRAIEVALAGGALPTRSIPLDPFIDPAHECATKHYLARVSNAIAHGETWLENVPAPAIFRQA